MNNKGLTLIELLAVILIIGLLSGVGLLSYNVFIERASERVYNSYEDTMKAHAEMHLINNPRDIPTIGNYNDLFINILDIDPINNPDDSEDKCLNSYVKVTRGNNTEEGNINLTYKVCLICNSYKSEGC